MTGAAGVEGDGGPTRIGAALVSGNGGAEAEKAPCPRGRGREKEGTTRSSGAGAHAQGFRVGQSPNLRVAATAAVPSGL